MGYLGKQITITGTQNSKRLSVLATDGQTTFTVSNGYTIGQLDVYRNGVKLSVSRDFTAADGVSVTLIDAANANDIIEFVVFENFDVTDAITTGGNQTITGDLTVEGNFTAGTALTVTNGGVTAGILTAQSFHGDGTNLTNVGVDTAQVSTSGLVVSGISTLAGATFSGLSTFASQAEFDANVKIDGNNQLRLGTGGNSFFYHGSDNDTYLQTNNNELLIGGPTVRLQSYGSVGSAGENYLVGTQNGSVDLYYDNSKKFETDAGGVKITGVCTATSFSGTVASSNLSGALPALDGSALTNLNIPAGFNELDAALFN